jgi:isopentenyl-diphosphate delta-isomerase
MEQQVILVDEQDRELGFAGKTEAHQKGQLHRAFSIFIFNPSGEMLLQQRAINKYHSGGLWSNACCSHPQPGEEINAAAHRRLQEELGIVTSLNKLFNFVYSADVGPGLTEHELDHVFTGEYAGELSVNQAEIADVAFRNMTELHDSVINDPEKYTAWFRLAFPKIFEWWQARYKGNY